MHDDCYHLVYHIKVSVKDVLAYPVLLDDPLVAGTRGLRRPGEQLHMPAAAGASVHLCF
jgi:hypothetical protein